MVNMCLYAEILVCIHMPIGMCMCAWCLGVRAYNYELCSHLLRSWVLPKCVFLGVVPNCGRNRPIARLNNHKPKQSRPSNRKAIEWRRMHVVVCVGPDGQTKTTTYQFWGGLMAPHRENTWRPPTPSPQHTFYRSHTYTEPAIVLPWGGASGKLLGCPG